MYPDQAVNSILLGDTTELLPQFADNSVDCIIIDPPYGVDFKEGQYDDTPQYVFSHYYLWLKELARILKPDRYIFLFIPTLYITEWLIAVKTQFQFKNLLAFAVYCNNRFNYANNFSFNAQYVIVASKGNGIPFNKVDWIPTSDDWIKDKRNPNPKPYTYCYPNFFVPTLTNRLLKEEWSFFANNKNNTLRKANHPNEKNPEIIQKLIEITTQPNELVLDSFMGCGTTAMACLQSHRQFIGIEKSPIHYQTATDRIKSFQSKLQTQQKQSLDRFFGGGQ